MEWLEKLIELIQNNFPEFAAAAATGIASVWATFSGVALTTKGIWSWITSKKEKIRQAAQNAEIAAIKASVESVKTDLADEIAEVRAAAEKIADVQTALNAFSETILSSASNVALKAQYETILAQIKEIKAESVPEVVTPIATETATVEATEPKKIKIKKV